MSPLPADLERLLHDLRGPLNAIAMHLQVIKRAVGDVPGAKPSLETIQGELDRLTHMLAAAFDVVAIERRDVARYPLRALVEELLRESGADGAITVAAGEWPIVHGDRRLLKSAIGAAVHRALEATRAGRGARQPEIAVESTPETIILLVRDWGPRPASTDPRVLLRLSPTSSAEDLLGADRIARLHGGTLRFAALEGGTEVRLTLPR